MLNVGVGEEESLKPSSRPATLTGHTTRIQTPLGNLFVTVNSADGKPFELFAQIGKAGSDVVAFTEAIARLISLALRCGVGVKEIIAQLEGIGGYRSVGFGPNRIMCVPDAIGRALAGLVREKSGEGTDHYNSREICPEGWHRGPDPRRGLRQMRSLRLQRMLTKQRGRSFLLRKQRGRSFLLRSGGILVNL